MSKRKRNVAFLKPDEPAFITRMKAAAGYKEGPTVDTKREALSFDEDGDDYDDEEPQVVVLKEGDLTAEEASKAKVEKEEGPADLTQRVVFKKPDKAKKTESSETPNIDSSSLKKSSDKEDTKTSSKKKLKAKSVLSFTVDDEEDS
ncbi:uncharacterized protein KIAA1143 homolog [Thrips palmi]|uniref:Uncharacterized protein KIAA1143 homolog n=1 Tax=Thrips palmi TaxID=161013 RepID=A0A6P8YG76_THRPL|nr:uncharacterized protein KIAA1143 homolog [Thrips palmi]